jgi:hypothetical protein
MLQFSVDTMLESESTMNHADNCLLEFTQLVLAPIPGKIILTSVAGPRFASVYALDGGQEDYGRPQAIS